MPGSPLDSSPPAGRPAAVTRFFATPHGLDLGKAADFHGVSYSRSSSLADFQRAFSLALGTGGPTILEVRTHRERTHERRREVIGAVAKAVEGLKAQNDA